VKEAMGMGAMGFFLRRFPGLLKNAEKESFILRHLRTAVGRAFQTKFYAEKLSKAGVTVSAIRTRQDYRRMVPLTTRVELEAADPYDLLAIQPGKECLIYAQTSGTTTSKPVPTWVTRREFENTIELALCMPLFQKHLSKDMKIAICYPYTRTLAGRAGDLIVQKSEATLIPIGTRNNMYPPELAAETLRKLRIDVLGAAATDAFAYANILMDRGIHPKDMGVKFIMSGAEPCSENRARALGKVWGQAKVFSLLAQNESGFAGIPCERNLMHIPSFAIYTELMHEDGTEAFPGERALSVVTPTMREAMPVLRYVTGDYIEMLKEPCACGLPLPAMRVLGRKGTDVKVGPSSYFPIELENILYKSDLNGVWYQIRASANRLDIVAEHRDEGDYPRLESEIRRNFETAFSGVTVNVKMVHQGSLYNYRELRIGKPISRVIAEMGKGEIIERA
jgi:phenylacetate-CoA ligase